MSGLPTRSVRAAVVYQSGLKTPYTESQPVKVEEVELAGPGQGEVLVKMVAAGVCHSDLAVIEGIRRFPLPIVLGHEAAGIVADVGEGIESIKKGDHVVMSYVPSCGRCVYCASGKPNLCDVGRRTNAEGTLINGAKRFRKADKELHHHLGVSAFSEYTIVSENSVIPVRKDVPLEKLPLFGCAVLTGIGAVINTAKVQAGSSVAVFGCGGVGLSVIQGASLAGALQIIAVDVVDGKLELATELGATDVVNAKKIDPIGAIKSLTKGLGVDYAFEATGRPSVMEQALLATKKGGRTILIGITSPEDRITIAPSMLVDGERSMHGSYMGSVVPRRDVPTLIDLYAAGKIKLEKIISRYIKIDELNEAFDALARGDVARQIVKLS